MPDTRFSGPRGDITGQGPCHAFFLVGPTGSGKTAVAQCIAESEGHDILSADSMLVYRGMDIGTAKPTPADRRKVRYWGVDIVAPDQSFSVGAYHSHAMQALEETVGAGRRMIVSGGTGLYIKSLTHGFDRLPPADPEVRRKLEQIFYEKGIEGLRGYLMELDKSRYERLKEKDNPRRLIRAIELTLSGESEPDSWQRGTDVPIVGLKMDMEALYNIIRARAEYMFMNGLLDEVETLKDNYSQLSETAREAIGYREAMDVLKGRLAVDDAIEQTSMRTRRLAKRQMTWFRHHAKVNWINISAGDSPAVIAQYVKEMWAEYGPTAIAN